MRMCYAKIFTAPIRTGFSTNSSLTRFGRRQVAPRIQSPGEGARSIKIRTVQRRKMKIEINIFYAGGCWNADYSTYESETHLTQAFDNELEAFRTAVSGIEQELFDIK